MRHALIDPEKVYKHLKDTVQWALCAKCGWYWPETKLNDRGDGMRICPNHGDQFESSDQRGARITKAAGRLKDGGKPIPKWPSTPEMRNVSAVWGISPLPLQMATFTPTQMVLTGRNLSSTDAFVFVQAGTDAASAVEIVGGVGTIVFSTIDPETRKNTATFLVQCTAPIKFDLLVNGERFPKVLDARLS